MRSAILYAGACIVAISLGAPVAHAQSGPYGLPGNVATYNSMGIYGAAMPGEAAGAYEAPSGGYNPAPLGPVWIPQQVPMQPDSGLNTSPYPYGVGANAPYGGPPDPWR